jgi:hypothetical protein
MACQSCTYVYQLEFSRQRLFDLVESAERINGEKTYNLKRSLIQTMIEQRIAVTMDKLEREEPFKCFG